MSFLEAEQRLNDLRRKCALKRQVLDDLESLNFELVLAHADVSALTTEGPIWLSRQIIPYDDRLFLRGELAKDIRMKWREIAYLERQIAYAISDIANGRDHIGIIGTDYT